MVNPTGNIALSRPPLDATGWDVDINQNSDKVDALFSGTTGHEHTGATGQGKKVAIGNLAGVTITSPVTGHVLKWNGTAWVNAAASSTLAALTDANIASPTNGQILQYQTSDGKWHNAAAPPQALASQTDTNIASPANGEILQYQTSDSKWHNAPAPAQALSGQTDVLLTSPADGEALVYETSSGKWKNKLTGHVVQDEGFDVPQRKRLNFIGSGVTATDNPTLNSTDILVTYGGAGAGIVQNMDAIQTITLGTDQATVTFTGIPQNYRHLILKWTVRLASTVQRLALRLNGDTASNYDWQDSWLNQSSALGSEGAQAGNNPQISLCAGSDSVVAGSVGAGELLFPDYSRNTTFFKTWTGQGFSAWNGNTCYKTWCGGNWRSTAPITSVTIQPQGAGNIAAGSVLTLYGIRDAATTGQMNAPETINATIDGGGSALASGVKADLEVPFDCQIQYVTLMADQIGTVTLDIRRSSFASWPTVASIMGTVLPSLTSAQKSQTMADASWSRYLSAGDVLQLYLPSNSSYVTRLSVGIKVIRL
jgi:hypothetical protein